METRLVAPKRSDGGRNEGAFSRPLARTRRIVSTPSRNRQMRTNINLLNFMNHIRFPAMRRIQTNAEIDLPQRGNENSPG